MNDYKITIRSTVDGETNEVILLGNVYKEYGYTTVRYENAENNDPTKVVIGKEVVSITREGEMKTFLTFEKDKVFSTSVSTSFGEIPIVLKTVELLAVERDEGVDLKLAYVTDFGGTSSKFDLSLSADKIAEK